MTISTRHLLITIFLLCELLLYSNLGYAMTFGQLKGLEGTALLELRISEVFRHCGLPSAIADTADDLQGRNLIRWGNTEMELSSMNWKVIYSGQRVHAGYAKGWVNQNSGGVECLAGLSELDLHAKADSGILSVKKREDGNGYITSYDVPKDLYVSHQVIGLTGRWKRGVSIARIYGQYGEPDEVLKDSGGRTVYRYWVEAKEKDMPVSLHAVDFELKDGRGKCTRYTIRSSGFEFVQEKLDSLLRQWEKTYMD